MELCQEEPIEKCRMVTEEVCHTEPQTSCVKVPKQEARQECRDIPREVRRGGISMINIVSLTTLSSLRFVLTLSERSASL